MKIKAIVENVGCILLIIVLILSFLLFVAYPCGVAMFAFGYLLWEINPFVFGLIVLILLLLITRWIYKQVKENQKERHEREERKEKERKKEEEIKHRQKIFAEYECIRKKYPHGFSIWYKKHCVTNKKITKFMVVEDKDEITQLEEEYIKEQEVIQSQKAETIKRQKEIDEVFDNYFFIRKRIQERMERRNGLPYYYFYNYYPKSQYGRLSPQNGIAQRLIELFQEGKSPFIKNLVLKIRSVIDYNLEAFTFVCVPAETQELYNSRYNKFMNRICELTGMANGFEYIKITKGSTPTHLGGIEEMEYSCDTDFFKQKVVIVFGDVITSGRSLDKLLRSMDQAGARVLAAFFLGETVGPYSNQDEIHPWDLDRANPCNNLKTKS